MKRTVVVELEVESDDGPAAFEYFVDSVDAILDAGAIQDCICEHLGDHHPVNVEVVSAVCYTDCLVHRARLAIALLQSRNHTTTKKD